MKRTFRLVHETARISALACIRDLPINTRKPLVIVVDEEKAKRSLDQNARYWALLGQASQTTGEESESLHYACKCRFLGYKEIEIEGQVFRVASSTAKLGTRAFMAYCDQVEAWLFSNGLITGDKWAA